MDANNRLDDLSRNLKEAESSKKGLDVENQDLNRQIEELEIGLDQANKANAEGLKAIKHY